MTHVANGFQRAVHGLLGVLGEAVAGVMTGGVVSLPLTASAHQARLALACHDLRHLVVVDGRGALAGLVSRVDLYTSRSLDVEDLVEAIHAATDITGFGLLGHALHIAQGSQKSLMIDFNELPFFERTRMSLEKGFLTKAHRTNREYVQPHTKFENLAELDMQCLFDPQTSGGLLLSVTRAKAEELVTRLQTRFTSARVVGEVDVLEHHLATLDGRPVWLPVGPHAVGVFTFVDDSHVGVRAHQHLGQRTPRDRHEVAEAPAPVATHHGDLRHQVAHLVEVAQRQRIHPHAGERRERALHLEQAQVAVTTFPPEPREIGDHATVVLLRAEHPRQRVASPEAQQAEARQRAPLLLAAVDHRGDHLDRKSVV